MTLRFLLASPSEEDNFILKRKIDPLVEDLGVMQFISVRPQGLISSVDSNVNVVILNTSVYSQHHHRLLVDLRDCGYAGPTLYISKCDDPAIVRELNSMEHAVFLAKPFEMRDLHGIVRKFAHDRQVAQRIYRRFNTNQRGEIEFYDNKDRINMTLLNISKGGAYFEFLKPIPIHVGDVVKLKINLDQINRSYDMPAKVVWLNPKVSDGKGPGVGVEFMGRGEARKALFRM